jgi:serine/threonine protein kinase/Tfp pilus assembly protein PilF
MALKTGVRVGPYEILSLLGAGGMGEVYKAHDTRLQRTVALKVLPAEMVADAGRKQRFLVEAQTASQLNHSNIVTIYDIPEVNGVCFIAMEYVPGSTLEQVNASGGIPLKDAIKYATEIADALAAAHSAGIVHRDLKPANIIITEDGRIKLLDFGLAKLTEPAMLASKTEATWLRTAPGVVRGTAAYMSPEQAEGKTLDARSDIFSFGLVLYEMLCGRRAFQGDSWISTLAAILNEEARPLRDVKASVPPAAAQHVTRCLQKDPAHRFQTMLEIKQALAEMSSSLTAKEEVASIAVLPFLNLSADKENEYFSDGLAEEIINALTKVPELKVIARTSAFSFRGTDKDLRAIGQRLRVGTILEGSVRRAGNRIRVTAQLIKVSDESHLWSERFDAEMTDIFAIQDEISQAIADALKVKLTAPQRRTANIEAFQNYLKGLYWYQRYTPESLAKAREAFEQSLAHDPDYAPAHAGLAVFYYGLGALSIRRMIEMAPLAKLSADRALAIDPTIREAYSVLGLVAGTFEYDWKLAEQHFQDAMAADPVPPLVRVRYALYYLTPLRRFEEAVAQYRRALEIDPLSSMVHFGLAFALYCARQYDDAIEYAIRAVELYPDYWLGHFALGVSLAQTGASQQAIASLETTIRLSPSFTLAAGFLAVEYVRSGDLRKAEKLMEEIMERSAKQYVSPACFGIYHAARGEEDKMFQFLQAAWMERDPYLTRIDVEPVFAPFHSDPRYRELMDSMNLG